jgi:hypothetical protein
MFMRIEFLIFRVLFLLHFFRLFQNHGVVNVGLHNHVFEQTIDFITAGTCEVLHEKVFGLFIENALPTNFRN